MVLCHLHIISLKDGITVGSFLRKLRQNGIKPVVQARAIRWMIRPTELSASHLLSRNLRWDLFLILKEADSIPQSAQADIQGIFSASCGVSSKALSGYAAINTELLRPAPGSVAPPEPHQVSPSATSQKLEGSAELNEWIAGLPVEIRSHPVSMLNLLAFNSGKLDDYKKYGTEFAARVGSKHGGRVKIVGKVAGGQAQDHGWEEVAFVHYPSVQHFASMAANKDYQEINHKYRLGALKDTLILCVMEIDDEGNLVNVRSTREKL
ncbi:uncharacterized protein F4822DRAFT_16780 [Hypoxylon trugodes]|uniref:uncharacterized protein n=1 Tax=Hypoxylon trugodes TaxID=326681 RepID=UPI00218F90E5|nr:uncharacterized protein F4822DRAFT_16780 [Hypoxylon trugodes]KAI1393563.1 hypothetical protein F4822DRAFT_16780 [Hypoxylon trugodes]